MARFRRQNVGRAGPKRLTDWSLGVLSTGFVAIAAQTKVLLVSFSSAALAVDAPATIIHTRGIIAIASDQIVATEDQVGAFGIAFVNETARALGVTAIPGPGTDSLYDGWFVHQQFAQHFMFAAGTERAFDARGATQYVIDSKAMRKFESDEGMVVMLENTDANDGFLASVSLRFLIKAG